MDSNELLLFGERVRNQRSMAKLTQEHVAGKIGISLRFYQMIERGEKSLSLDTLIGLAKALNTSVDYLLLGNLPNHFDHPIVELFHQLTPHQRDNAFKIIQLYADACLKRDQK